MFEGGKAPRWGNWKFLLKMGVIQKLSRRVVADAPARALKLLDATPTEDAATGLLINQTNALIAAQCILCPAKAVAQNIRRNVQRKLARNTRVHL